MGEEHEAPSCQVDHVFFMMMLCRLQVNVDKQAVLDRFPFEASLIKVFSIYQNGISIYLSLKPAL